MEDVIEAAIKAANMKLFTITAAYTVDVTWVLVIDTITGDEYQAYLAGYLSALDLYDVTIDLSKDANSWNI